MAALGEKVERRLVRMAASGLGRHGLSPRQIQVTRLIAGGAGASGRIWLGVILRRPPEALPLDAVVTEHDQAHALLLDEIEELAGARSRLLGVLVSRPWRTVGNEESSQHHGIDREQNRPTLGQGHEDRLVAGGVAACFNQAEAFEKINIAIDQAVLEALVVPMLPSARETFGAVEGSQSARTTGSAN